MGCIELNLGVGCGCRHRWTGRFEAHLWDKSSWNDKQLKKGRQGERGFEWVLSLFGFIEIVLDCVDFDVCGCVV